MQVVVEGIPDVIGCFLRDDFGKIPVTIGSETPQGTGANYNDRRYDKRTALPGSKHRINTPAEHPGYNQAEAGGCYKAYRSQEQSPPVFFDEAQ